MTITVHWGISPYHPERAHTAMLGTDVSVCTRHLNNGQLVLESLTAHRPGNLRICPECAVETLAILCPNPPQHRRAASAAPVRTLTVRRPPAAEESRRG